MSSTPPQTNQLLNILNPYSSMSRSSFPFHREPDSPSTMLLRELQGNDDAEPYAGDARAGSSRDRDLSPTPTPERRSSGRRTSGNTSFATAVGRSDSHSGVSAIDEDDGPSNSILFGSSVPEGPGGDRTPRSPPTPLPHHRPMVMTSVTKDPVIQRESMPQPSSPGPFAPPSSSASDSHSRDTSPGPSSISIYASGLEGVEGDSGPTSSRGASTSPESGPSRIRRAPTFKEPPRMSRRESGRSTEHASHDASGSKKERSDMAGYPDPPRSAMGNKKGKAKARDQGGRRYHALAPEEDEVDGLDTDGQSGGGTRRPKQADKKAGLNEYEKALWKWVNVEDLDGFLQEVYAYYKGKGLWCILLARFLNLITTFFVIGFSTFLFSCIDYTKLDSELSGPNAVGRLDDVLVRQCLTGGSFAHRLFIILIAAVYIFQLASFLMSIPRLLEMYSFYTHLLGIPDTLPWPEIVRLIGEIRKHNPITSLSNAPNGPLAEMVGEEGVQGAIKKLDAHDVANRILRQENYLIALFNKDLLDLRVRFPIPFSLVSYIPPTLLAPPLADTLPAINSKGVERRFVSFGKNTLTTALEWNLRFCLLGFLFDQRGQVRKEFVKERRRKDLVEGLKRRFIFMGVLNAIFAPFIVIYLLIYSFFRYFEEYHKNPSSIGSRQYTPYAQWKFREFNELPHLFERRLDRSYITAKEYIDQFPKERTALIMRFVAFVAGSFAAVLLVASLLDPDLFLHFEITPHRTVFFYLGIFGGILAVARGMVPEENLVFDPETSLREVVKWTHYLPMEWEGKLHSQKVHQEFGTLFAMKIMIFFQELLSVLLTPFILFFSLPPCAGALIDFFREFTVHVEGVGYVCSFAVFDFRRHGNIAGPSAGTEPPTTNNLANRLLPPVTTIDQPTSTRGAIAGKGAPPSREREREWARANENKMEKSFLHFKATHPDWIPDPSSSIFLDKLVGMRQQQIHQAPMSNGHAGRLTGLAGREGMASSMHAGGRGLGIGTTSGSIYHPQADIRSRAWGMDDKKLAERSRSYDRAWAKSSHLLKSSSRNHHRQGESHHFDQHGSRGLEPMAEAEETEDRGGRGKYGEDSGEEDYHDGNPAGLDRRGVNRDMEVEGDEDERGFLRDVGVVGILQQIMGR